MIDDTIWSIQKEIMKRHGVDAAYRETAPIEWYIITGRASAEFLRLLKSARPLLIARDCHKGGSYEEVINRVCKRLGYERR